MTRRIRRVAALLVALAVLAVGTRQVINANRFQLFGAAVARVNTKVPVVALTFDDGPHPVHTVPVLDLLDRHRAKATFFMMGRNVERHPEVAREVVARGHQVGNHTYSHPRLVFVRPAMVRDEIVRTDALLRGVGVTGDIPFRAPHLSKFVVLPYVLGRMGKLSVLADVDPEEWRRRPAEAMTADVLREVRPGSIVMMHDPAGRETLVMLGNVLESLTARGYRFETVSGLVAHGRRD